MGLVIKHILFLDIASWQHSEALICKLDLFVCINGALFHKSNFKKLGVSVRTQYHEWNYSSEQDYMQNVSGEERQGFSFFFQDVYCILPTIIFWKHNFEVSKEIVKIEGWFTIW
jgi:hypothetical protein